MAITEADINDMLAFLVTHPEYLDRFRALSITPELQTVPLRMDRVETAVATLSAEMTESFRRSTERLDRLDSVLERLVLSSDQLTERMDRMDSVVAELVQTTARLSDRMERVESVVAGLVQTTAQLSSRMERVESVVAGLVQSTSELVQESVRTGRVLNRLDGTVSNMKGKTLETRYSNNVENWFGDYVLAPVKVAVRRLPGLKDAEASGLLSPQDVIALRALDLVVRGQDEETGGEVYLAAEISNVIDVDDVARARQRADLMRRLQIDARAFVGGHEITSDAVTYATTAGVMVDLHPEG